MRDTQAAQCRSCKARNVCLHQIRISTYNQGSIVLKMLCCLFFFFPPPSFLKSTVAFVTCLPRACSVRNQLLVIRPFSKDSVTRRVTGKLD